VTPVVALAYLLVIAAKSSQTVYRVNMKEWLQRPDPLNGRKYPGHHVRPASSLAPDGRQPMLTPRPGIRR